MSNLQFTKAEDLKIEILNDIDMLLNIEKDLSASLENNKLTLAEKDKLLVNVKSVSDMRIELYYILDQINIYLQSALTNVTDTLSDQQYSLKIIENEVKISKNKLIALQDDMSNKYRQVQINTYYSQKYAEHNKLILWIITFLAILTLIVFLNKKNIISYTIYFWLLAVTILVGLFLIGYKIQNMSIRNNMNYQEYDINVDTKKYKKMKDSSTSKNKKDPWRYKPPVCGKK